MKKTRNYNNALPDFLEMQRVSFCWFISQGLNEELSLFSKIQDFSKNIQYLIFLDESRLIKLSYDLLIARKYIGNYKVQLTIPVEIRNKKSNKTQYKTRFPLITLPLMTIDATFILNGCERVIVSQIIRSPGIYFEKNKNQKTINKFKRKISGDIIRLRSFIPAGEATLFQDNFWIPKPLLIKDNINYEIATKIPNIIRVVPNWEDYSVLYYSIKYFQEFRTTPPFYFLKSFKLYRIISKNINTSSKFQLIQLFIRWLKLKSNLKYNKISYLIRYFNFLLKLINNYKILRQDYQIINKILFLSKNQTFKLFKKYNKILIKSQNLTYFYLNSEYFLIITQSYQWLYEINNFSFLKKQINYSNIYLNQLNFIKLENFKPIIYFPDTFKDLLKATRVRSKKFNKAIIPFNKHLKNNVSNIYFDKYLKNNTQILTYKEDHEIKTYYNNKYDEKELYTATLIPDYGSWIRFIFKKNTKINSYKYPLKYKEDELIIQLDKISQKPILLFLREIGLTDLEIYQNLEYSDFFYFNKPLFIDSKILNQLLPRFNIDRKDFQKISEFSKIFDPTFYQLNKIGRFKINNKLNINFSYNVSNITYEDIFAIINKLINLTIVKTIPDNIDHLKNKRVRSIGELLQNLFKIGFQRLNRNLKNYIPKKNPLNKSEFLGFSTVNLAIKEFFGSSELSQYLDQTNPLSSLTHRRRISSLGPGGLDRDRISFSVRDIHPSHYGRICPIETPEGQNVGLIASLTSYARVNRLGFLETPFWRVINGKVLKDNGPIYLTADIEDFYRIAPADIITNRNNYLIRNIITVRYKQEFRNVTPSTVDFIAISTIQVVSIATSLIPFFEHDDANRALMGSNMQRQSIPLILPQKPIIGTGLENQIAIDSGMAISSQSAGIVSLVTANKIVIRDKKNRKFIYKLQKYLRSNQKTCINQRPIVWKGEIIKSGQILSDGPAIINSELSLGQNVLVGYMPWQGYNFEDAILISERLIYDDIFTSIHIERYKIEIDNDYPSETSEEITKNIPNLDFSEIKHLNDDGIIKIGTFVKSEDILVGKIILNNNYEHLPESKFLRAIFGTKAKGIKDNSYRMPYGKYGRVVETVTFNRRTVDTYKSEKIYIFIAQVRKIQVGDKIAGRHGNKGIISRILSRHDMPFLPDGTPIDIILNPLGVPSRMNVGQLYECLLGLAGDKLNSRFKIVPFDEMYGLEISRILINKKLRQASKVKNQSWLFNPYTPGKVLLIDGRTGITFENPITIGNAYMLKLIHLVADKIHARATGPYSLITQQPLRGKANHGGQRFGEMEVWALEGFGAAFTLKELLTIKSDDMDGRNETLTAIIKGQEISQFGIPESFKVLLQELRSIGIDISTYKIEKFSSQKKYQSEINLIEKYNALAKMFSPNSKKTKNISF
uniref:DNA-directed RNA polymerase subunit beta n=1 Tax=Climaconeis cf. scalaris TaxID=2846828 RepID=A0A8F8X8C3_9STRA|nr:RNA polymerase beta subunit [Climaconeis cf. scalaris]